MHLMKSVLVGVVAAVLAAVAVAAVMIVFSIGAVIEVESYSDAGGGIGAEYVSINPAAAYLAGVVAGVAGFAWQWRRTRRPAGDR